ncbi:hypothetical protein [Candidatus Tisiphia endosymbiont of Empis tessellata]|uniref:hypothetical protein n=1 Tax=Candidatus Tisiphia endosymbiont of Empis tessellata TaxID=3066259 RepID=UPI00313BD4B8
MSDYILDIFDKLAYAEEFKEATESQPAADDDVREEQSTGSMNKDTGLKNQDKKIIMLFPIFAFFKLQFVHNFV